MNWELITTEGALLAVAGLLIGIVVGFLLGRGRNVDRTRLRDLESELAESQDQLNEMQDEVNQYSEQVVSHFSKTSDLLKAMTIQYRSLYEHLAEGAEKLQRDDTALGTGSQPTSLLLDFEEDARLAAKPSKGEQPTAEDASASKAN